MVNAWGRGTPLPPTDRDPDRHFGIEVVFTDAEGEKDVHHEEFSADILDWQFLSRIVVAKKDYVKVQVSYVYSHQANTAYFEGLALFLEEFGQSYTYDEDNNLISAVDNQKNRQEFEYSDANDMTGVTDAKGNSFTYVYDDKHRVTQGTSAEGVVYRYEYDDATGNVQKSGVVLVEEDPAEPEKGTWVTRTMTSDKNHVASVTDAEGNTVRYGWNLKKDLMTSLTDAKGNKLSYTYDVQKRLTKVSQDVTVDGAVTKVANEYAYADDRLSSILHNGFRYGFAYDGFGNTEAVTIAGENVVSYEYGAGNEELVRTVYGNGAGIRYTYDDQDRLKKSYYCDSASGTEAELNTYVYDKQGNLQKVTNHPSGKTYILSYDFLDRLMRVRDEAGNIYEYTYDANNQMTRLKHANPSGASRTDYSYDKDGRETGSTVGGFTRNTFYDQLGRVTDQQWEDENNESLVSITYSYPSNGDRMSARPDLIRIGNRELAYTYDANGNILSVMDSTGKYTVSYQYDERNQLIRENNKSIEKTFVYTYDIGGNLTNIKEYAYTTNTPANPVNEITGVYASSGWKDQLTRWGDKNITYDAVGNMIKKGTDVTYTWTQGRKLAGCVKGSTTSQYQYDHTGLRVKKTVGNTVTEYCYAGRLLLSETTGTTTIYYHYDSAANLVAVTIGGVMYFYVKNLAGDIIGLVDGSGNTVVEYTYDSWGNPSAPTGSLASTIGKQNPFRYKGYYYDSESGLYYLGSRYYDPEIKRFICADKIGTVKASMETLHNENLYLYCDNNPVTRRDDEGNMWGVAVLAFAVGAAASVVNQCVFGDKDATISSIVIDAVTSGLGVAMSVMGAGAVAQAVVGVTGDFLSGIANGDSAKESAVNAAIGLAIGTVTDHVFAVDTGDYLSCTRDYKRRLKNIRDKNMGAIESIPHFTEGAQTYRKKMKKITRDNINTYYISYGLNEVRKAPRIIGWGRKINPKTGLMQNYAMYENGTIDFC